MSKRKTAEDFFKETVGEFWWVAGKYQPKFIEGANSFAKQEVDHEVQRRDELIKEMAGVLKSIKSVLEENSQAQIAGYYNHDKTETDKTARNKVIEEYTNLIAIINPRINHVLTKAQSFNQE